MDGLRVGLEALGVLVRHDVTVFSARPSRCVYPFVEREYVTRAVDGSEELRMSQGGMRVR